MPHIPHRPRPTPQQAPPEPRSLAPLSQPRVDRGTAPMPLNDVLELPVSPARGKPAQAPKTPITPGQPRYRSSERYDEHGEPRLATGNLNMKTYEMPHERLANIMFPEVS